MSLVLKTNNILSTPSTTVIGVTVCCKNMSILEVLETLHTFQREHFQENTTWLQHPLSQEKIASMPSGHPVYYIEPSKKLNTLFQHASLLEKIHYLDIIGITIAIDRHSAFRDVVRYQRFCHTLTTRGITNPSWTIENMLFKDAIKRIHVVHADFLDDPEIAQGLHVSYRKNTHQDKVLYVCSEELLSLALKYCTPGATLIIDGHWEHQKHSMHGVWDNADASMIAASLHQLSEDYPDKICYIRLWGCSSGKIADFASLSPEFNPDNLYFKDACVPDFQHQAMAAFRNRAVYYTTHTESLYDKDSLAGQLMQQLPTSIRITAVPSYGYPFPAQSVPQFNIGSDTDAWRGEHAWTNTTSEDCPIWYKKLNQLKSLTIIRDEAGDRVRRWPEKIAHTTYNALTARYGLLGTFSSSSNNVTDVGDLDDLRKILFPVS